MSHQGERRSTPTRPSPDEDEEEITSALLDILSKHMADELFEEFQESLDEPESFHSDRKWGKHQVVLNFARTNWPKLLAAYLDFLGTTEEELLQSWNEIEPGDSSTNDISQLYLHLFILFSEDIRNENEDDDDFKYDSFLDGPKMLSDSSILSGLIFDAYQQHFLGSAAEFLCFPKSLEQFYVAARIFDIGGAQSDRRIARDKGSEIHQHVIRDRPGKSEMFRDRRASEILPFRMAEESRFDDWVEIATGFYDVHRILITGENQNRHCAVVFVFQMHFAGSYQEDTLWLAKTEELSWTTIKRGDGCGREFWSQKFLEIRDELDSNLRLSVVLIRFSGDWQYHVLKREDISRDEDDMFYTSFRDDERTRMFSALNQWHGEHNMSLIAENQSPLNKDSLDYFVRGYMTSGGVQWRVRSAQELGQVLNLFRPCRREKLVFEDGEMVEDDEANDVLTRLNGEGWFTRR